MEIFTTIQFLARQGIALRGHEELQSNFNQLLLLRTRENPELRNWLDRKTSWTSHDIQNEILQLMRKVLETIQKRDFFAILADETADISRKEQLSFSIRTVDDLSLIHI